MSESDPVNLRVDPNPVSLRIDLDPVRLRVDPDQDPALDIHNLDTNLIGLA